MYIGYYDEVVEVWFICEFDILNCFVIKCFLISKVIKDVCSVIWGGLFVLKKSEIIMVIFFLIWFYVDMCISCKI